MTNYSTSNAQLKASRKWKSNNKDRIKTRQKLYRETHPEYNANYNNKSKEMFNVPNGKIPWTLEEIKFLEDNYSNMTAMEIAETLHRSFKAVARMKEKLKLHKVEHNN